MKTIAILGTGPAGMFAAHAAALQGKPFALFGLPDEQGAIKPSVIGGAQFLHTAVPYLADAASPDFQLTYRKIGTGEGYKHKVYGGDDVPFVSFDRVTNGAVVPAWSLRRAYARAWESICSHSQAVNPLRITTETIQDWLDRDQFQLIICTLPRMEVCRAFQGLGGRPHAFMSQSIQVGEFSMNVAPNEIVYNGDEEFSWYRSSVIDGIGSTEWGGQVATTLRKAYPDLRVIKKPIRHDCDCWHGKPIVFAGRYGEWRKGVLTHEAFTTTWQALENL